MNIASIDIGTNTVLLLIAEVDPVNLNLKPLLNIHRMPRLGKGVNDGSMIGSDKVDELKRILLLYRNTAVEFNVQKIIVTATNVFRIASNARNICKEIEKEFDLKINIVSGEEEARLAFLGAISTTDDHKEFLVIDIGGGSTEIIVGTRDCFTYRKSFQIGAVSATEMFLSNDPPDQVEIKRLEQYLLSTFSELKKLHTDGYYSIAIAGTPTTLACIKNNLTDFNDKVIERSELNLSEVRNIIDTLSKMTSRQIDEKWKKIMRGRADIILAGSLILFNLMKLMRLDKLYTSSRGIRYGAVIQFLSDNSKTR